MRQRSLAVTVLLSFLSARLLADATGTWSAEWRSNSKVQLHLRYDGSHMSTSIAPEQLLGLNREAVQSSTSQPVAFRLERDAGTFHLQGSFMEGEGAGHFRFEPNPSFFSGLRELGVKTSGKQAVQDASDVMTLAMFDVSRALVRELQSMGYQDLSLDDLTSMKIHGASPRFIRELRELGYDDLSVDDLIGLRIHGATPEYIREMASEGFRPHAEELTSMRIHGVQPAFVRELRSLGYAELTTDGLVSMRIHGVTAQFVKDLKVLGYERVATDDLISMRIHGVTTDFIRELHDAGYEHVPVEKLIELKIHRVDAAFIRALKRKGPQQKRRLEPARACE